MINKFIISEEIQEELETLFNKCDLHFKKIKKKSPIACQKGCNNCCRTFMWQGVEIAYVMQKISKGEFGNIKWLKTKLITYNKLHDQRIKGGHLTEIGNGGAIGAMDDIKCIFLHKGECSIYECRPLICRMTANESSKDCTGNSKLDKSYLETMDKLGVSLCEINRTFSEPIHGNRIVGFPFRFIN